MYPLFPPSFIPHPIGYGDATCQTTILRSTTWVPTSIAGCVLWLPPVAGFSGYMYTNAAGISEVTPTVRFWAMGRRVIDRQCSDANNGRRQRNL